MNTNKQTIKKSVSVAPTPNRISSKLVVESVKKELANKYDVDRKNISNIVNRIRWKYV
jgi:hypothetical protein